MNSLLFSGVLSILLCASTSVHAHEAKTTAQVDAAKPADSNAVTKIEGTVKSFDRANKTLVVVSASGQEYVLPYVEDAKAPFVVGQRVVLVIKACYRAYCISISIST